MVNLWEMTGQSWCSFASLKEQNLCDIQGAQEAESALVLFGLHDVLEGVLLRSKFENTELHLALLFFVGL